MDTILSFWPITIGLFTKSTGIISITGLSSANSYSFWVPIRKVITILSLWKFFALQVIMPFSYRSTTPSDTISEWIPRSFLPPRKVRTASGIEPIPNCKQSPSLIREATFSPMAFSVSPIFAIGSAGIGASSSTITSMLSTWIKLSPIARGMFGFTTATTLVFGHSAAGFV